jgi:hypothetical protein
VKAFFISCFSSAKAPEIATGSTITVAQNTKPSKTSIPVVRNIIPALSRAFIERKERKTHIEENKVIISGSSDVMTREANIFVASLVKACLDYIQQLLDSNPELITGQHSTTNKEGVQQGPF